MTLITIDSTEEQNRVFKFVKNFYGIAFWTSVIEQRTIKTLVGYIRQYERKVSICKEFRRHPQILTMYIIHETGCSSQNYSICYRKTEVENGDEDYECDCEDGEEEV